MFNFFKNFYIPAFFKTKKFLILFSILIFVFFFTPISLHQAGQKIETFINNKVVMGVEQFEQETGLKIQWSHLNFNIFLMTVILDDVQVLYLKESKLKKIKELEFLDGQQNIKQISARPSIYSLLFDKKIFLSKLKINGGDIYLKTLKKFKANVNESQNITLPIKKISVKNTNINLTHKNMALRFFDIKAIVFQKRDRVFNFDLVVNSVYVIKDSGFETVFNIQSNNIDKNKIYQLSMKGLVQKNQADFSQMIIKNDSFNSVTQSLKISFDTKDIKGLNVVSSGSLSVSLIKEALDLINKDFKISGSNVSYDLNLEYKKTIGYKGSFSLLSKNFIFKSEKLKKIDLKGKLNKYLLSINKSSIHIENQGNIYIKDLEWLFLKEEKPFVFSMELDQLSSDFITYSLLNIPYIPVKGNLTGLLSCEGQAKSFDYARCSLKGFSQTIKLKPKNQSELISAYGMNLDFILEWKDQKFLFELNGSKEPSTKINFRGSYSLPLDEFTSSYSFNGKLNEDLRFYTPIDLKGSVRFSNGRMFIKNNKIKLSGKLASPLLNLDDYTLENISSSYSFANNKLSFLNIRGRPGKTTYLAEAIIDFNDKDLSVQLDSSFFELQDFLKAVKDNFKPFVDLKGSGTVFFSIYWPWDKIDKKEFQIKGDFFNVFIEKDFFSQSTFDIVFKEGRGIVRSLLFRKGQGLIQGSGFFNESYDLDLVATGRQLSLESIELLNSVLPFNQSGDINFNLQVSGNLNEPDITGSADLFNTYFYSYPVKDSKLELKINKDLFSFSGRLIDEIDIEKFSYPFSKKSNFTVKGRFDNFDFIRILLSKYKKDEVQSFVSQLRGSFNIEKINNSFWTGLTKIDTLSISKSNQWFKNINPFSILFEKDKWSLNSSIRFMDHNNKKIHIEKTNEEELILKGFSSLGYFSFLVPFFEEFDGEVSGQLVLNNNLKKIKPRGSLYVEKALLSIYPLPDFTNVRAQLVFANNNIIINDFNSIAGGGAVTGLGNIFYNFTSPAILDLNLDFDKSYFQFPEGFNTKGSGKVKIKGSSPPYLIIGEYDIESGSIVREFSSSSQDKKYDFALLKEKDAKQKSFFNLDFKLKALEPIPINSSLIRSSITGQTEVYGPLDALLMKGKFSLLKDSKQSLIFFRGQEFKISSGSILFKNSEATNPYLNISADTVFKEVILDTLEGREGIEKEYKIFLSVDGFSENLEFSLKSQPVLNEREIISLLTLGVSSSRFDANVKQNITDVDYYPYQILTSLLIEKSLNREIKDTFGLDFRLTPYINPLNKPVTKITLSKNWFNKWNTSFSRTIEESAHSDIRLKYDLNEKTSLTAFWENRRQVELQETEEDFLGLDFEFNFDF